MGFLDEIFSFGTSQSSTKSTFSSLLSIGSGQQPLGTTATGRGGSTHQTVESAKSSYYAPNQRFKDEATGYYGTSQEIIDRAKRDGMGAMQLKDLEQRVAGTSSNFRW